MEQFLDRILKYKVIYNLEQEKYLKRWYLFRFKSFSVFVHKFFKSDEDRALHDHPWNYIVIPTWRGYTEYSSNLVKKFFLFGVLKEIREEKTKRIYPIIGIRYRKSTYRHRVELINNKPAWSIFIKFRKNRNWGFWPNNEYIYWEDFRERHERK